MGNENTSDFEIGYIKYTDKLWYKNFSVSGDGIGYFSNKLGIGTTNPQSKLEIKSSGTIGSKWNPNNSYLKISNGINSLIFDNNEIYSDEILTFGSSYQHPIVFRNVDNNGNEELMRIEENGNVGIGTANPQSKLEIKSSGTIGAKWNPKNSYLKISNGNHSLIFDNNEIYSNEILAIGSSYNHPIAFRNVDNNGVKDLMTIQENGKVGIGTTSPSKLLSLEGSSNSDIGLSIKNKSNTGIIYALCTEDNYIVEDQKNAGLIESYNDLIFSAAVNTNNSTPAIKFQTGRTYKKGNTRMLINSKGEVGIGTTTPDAKLDVAGNIKAQEIEVTLASIEDMQLNGTLAANQITYTTNGNTADFVFEEDYNLRELSEVENFIKTNKHLPDIPSATEMEEQGVNLAEMNKLLLQKVEELTLYSIGLEKARTKEKEERRMLENELKVQSEKLREKDLIIEERLAKIEEMLMNEDNE